MRQIVFLLFPKVHLLDFAGPAQVFYEANRIEGKIFHIQYASAFSNIIESEQDISFANLHSYKDLDLRKGDMVCIPGTDFLSFSKGELDEVIEKVKPWLSKQYSNGLLLSTICSGSLILARAGLLDHVKCTSHWKVVPYMKDKFPQIELIEDVLYYHDRGIYTSAGMSAGIDMCLHLVEKWQDSWLAAKVARELVINVRRQDTEDQEHLFLDFKNHFHPVVYKVQELINNNLQKDLSTGEIASRLNYSVRHLNRLFRHYTGQTIHQYKLDVKVNEARKLLENSELSVKEIAYRLGYGSPNSFIRAWNSVMDVPPARYRSESLKDAVQ
jgi:transcriptional regulator GlxA family with amidase domain